MRWRAYLRGGATFSDEDGAPCDVPLCGVLLVAQADKEIGRFIAHGGDYFVCVGGVWMSCDHSSLMLYLQHHLPDVLAVREGIMASEEEFAEAMHRANAEPGLPPRTGRRASEG